VPSQLGNSSGKFQYSKVEKGGRKRMLESPVEWLNAAQMTLPCYEAAGPQKPLKSYADYDRFELYISDVGILANALELAYADILADKLGEHKGAVTENYAAQELIACGLPLYNWRSSGRAEVDFLLSTDNGVVPVEVKSGAAVASKSLSVYMEKYRPPLAVRVSARNFGLSGGIKSVPLYAAFCLAGL